MKYRVRRFNWLALGAVLLFSVLPTHATFPGKNGRIAFVVGPDIYTINPDGSDVKQLTNIGPDSSAFWESWSPDGKLIVLNEYRPPDFLGQLWLIKLRLHQRAVAASTSAPVAVSIENAATKWFAFTEPPRPT